MDDSEPVSSGTEFVLTNPLGLHARPAAVLARSVADLNAKVLLRFGERQADASSVLALMSLGAQGGDRIEVAATGLDAVEALRRVGDLIARGFDE
jgi:PTS hybrid protein